MQRRTLEPPLRRVRSGRGYFAWNTRQANPKWRAVSL